MVRAKKPIRRGERRGSWTMISDTDYSVNPPMNNCQCVCGKIQSVRTKDLASGASSKCRACAEKLRSEQMKGKPLAGREVEMLERRIAFGRSIPLEVAASAYGKSAIKEVIEIYAGTVVKEKGEIILRKRF